MPAWLEKILKKNAAKKHLKGERKEAYIWGGLRKSGWKPAREKK